MREVQLMIETKQQQSKPAPQKSQNKYVADDFSDEEDSWALPSTSQQKPITQQQKPAS